MQDPAADTVPAWRSRGTTSWPAVDSAWHTAPPIKPVDPVTTHFKRLLSPALKTGEWLPPEYPATAASGHDTAAAGSFQCYQLSIARQRCLAQATDICQLINGLERSEHLAVLHNGLGAGPTHALQHR